MTNKITIEEVLKERQERFEASTAVIKTKGADYNRKQQGQGDTLFNMRVSTLLGITDNECQGVLVRLSDKFMRLSSLCADPTANPEVKDESVIDTIDDIHNYIDYLALFYKEARKKLEDAAYEAERIGAVDEVN